MKQQKISTVKKILLALAAIFVLIQFYRPEKNFSVGVSVNAIERHYNVPQNVGSLLKTSCYDCHSNNTKYPWYNNVQPVAFWLNSHINDGKRHLNFDEFNSYPAEKKKKKLQEVAETIENGEMPLSSYSLIHSDAKLSASDKQTLVDWAKTTSKEITD